MTRTLTFSSVEPDDISQVIKGLWKRGQKEATLFGITNKEELLEYLLACSSEYGFTLKVGEEPIAVFGAAGHDNKYNSWFVATDRFAEVGRSATLFLRGFLRDKVRNRPDAELSMFSAVEHPDAERWFSLLGFEKVDREGFMTIYKYNRKTID